MLIWLLRHGETAYNAARRYQGWRDIPLSEAGLAALRQAEFAPAVVYTSPLCRTAQTAAALFPGARLVPVEDLREMDFGDFEGRSYRDMEHDPAYRAWVEGYCLGRCPGGSEDRAQFTERVCHAFSALVDRALQAGEERLVIVAHGGTQMAALSRYGQPRREYYAWQTGGGGGFVLDAAPWPEEKKLTLLREVSYKREE